MIKRIHRIQLGNPSLRNEIYKLLMSRISFYKVARLPACGITQPFQTIFET